MSVTFPNFGLISCEIVINLPGLSSSSALLACRGCPAFTGFKITLSPTTTYWIQIKTAPRLKVSVCIYILCMYCIYEYLKRRKKKFLKNLHYPLDYVIYKMALCKTKNPRFQKHQALPSLHSFL